MHESVEVKKSEETNKQLVRSIIIKLLFVIFSFIADPTGKVIMNLLIDVKKKNDDSVVKVTKEVDLLGSISELT